MSINPQAGPVPSQAGPPYPANGPDRARAHVRRLRQEGGTYRGIAAAAGVWPRRPSLTWTAAAAGLTAAPPPRCSP